MPTRSPLSAYHPKQQQVAHAKNLRPSNLLDIVRKTYTTILVSRVASTWAMPKRQVGSLKGSQVLDALLPRQLALTGSRSCKSTPSSLTATPWKPSTMSYTVKLPSTSCVRKQRSSHKSSLMCDGVPSRKRTPLRLSRPKGFSKGARSPAPCSLLSWGLSWMSCRNSGLLRDQRTCMALLFWGYVSMTCSGAPGIGTKLPHFVGHCVRHSVILSVTLPGGQQSHLSEGLVLLLRRMANACVLPAQACSLLTLGRRFAEYE